MCNNYGEAIIGNENFNFNNMYKDSHTSKMELKT